MSTAVASVTKPSYILERRILKRRFLMHVLPLDLRLQLKDESHWHFSSDYLIRRRHSVNLEDKDFFSWVPILRSRPSGKSLLLDTEDSIRKKIVISGWRLHQEYRDVFWAINEAYYLLDESLVYADARPETMILLGYVGASLVSYSPEIAREWKSNLRNLGADFPSAIIAATLGEFEEVRSIMMRYFSEGEYYAAGRLAVWVGDREMIKQSMNQLHALIRQGGNLRGKLPKIFPLFYPLGLGSNDYLFDFSVIPPEGIEIAEDQMKKLKFAFVELLSEAGPKDPEYLWRWFQILSRESSSDFEAGFAALLLGNWREAKKRGLRLQKEGKRGLSWALALAIGRWDSEYGLTVFEKNLKEWQDAILPPTAAGMIAAAALKQKPPLKPSQRSALTDLLVRLSDAGGPWSLYIVHKINLQLNTDRFEELKILDFMLHPDRDHKSLTCVCFMDWLKFLSVSDSVCRTLKILNGDAQAARRYSIALIAILLERAPQELSYFASQYSPLWYRLINQILTLGYGHAFPNGMLREMSLNFASRLLAYLQFVFGDEAPEIVENLMQREGGHFFAVSEYLRIGLSDPKILESLKRVSPPKSKNWSKEIADILLAYLRLGDRKALIRVVRRLAGKENFPRRLKQSLSNLLAKGLGVSRYQTWKQVQNLPVHCIGQLVRQRRDLSIEADLIRRLYKAVIKSALTGKFSLDLRNRKKKSGIWKQIVQHNQRVEKVFRAHQLSWDHWCGFLKEFYVELAGWPANRRGLWMRLETAIQDLEISFQSTPLFGSILKDTNEFHKQKNNPNFFADSGKNLTAEQWLRKFFPKYSAGFDYLVRRGRVVDGLGEDLAATIDRFLGVREAIEALRVDCRNKFFIRLWRREPLRDIFQGNFSDCCIAIGVGTHPQEWVRTLGLEFYEYPAGILDFLVDEGVQVAEIIEKNTEDTIAQAWLFVTLDQDQKPVLVADTFEINPRYRDKNKEFSQLLELFLREYAKAIGCQMAAFGSQGPGDYQLGIHIKTDKFPRVLLPPIQKLGGTWHGKPYFLETIGATEAFMVYKQPR